VILAMTTGARMGAILDLMEPREIVPVIGLRAADAFQRAFHVVRIVSLKLAGQVGGCGREIRAGE
jgi:hypothetical protein